MESTLIHGNALEQLALLPARSVHCCVTSPPYWGLRDYGLPPTPWPTIDYAPMPGLPPCVAVPAMEYCLGLEPTPEAFIGHLVLVFREVWRVLRDDATLWLNLGDSFANDTKWGGSTGGKHAAGLHGEPIGRAKRQTGLKAKDMVGIPWRAAFALQADGWYLRSDVIWHKKNPLPESVADRPTKAHEYIFLFAKNERYYYDAEAIKEPCSESTHARVSQDLANQVGSFRANGGNKTNGPMKAVIAGSTRKIADSGSGIANNRSYEGARALVVETRNKRTVWTVGTKPYKEAHFATFPPDLIEPCILAGTSARGCCSKCGAPYMRTIERSGQLPGRERNVGGRSDGLARPAQWENGQNPTTVTTTGWQPTCECGAEAEPCIVLDPFNGAGTTGLVALNNGRDYIGIDLKEDYLAMSERRLQKAAYQPELLTT